MTKLKKGERYKIYISFLNNELSTTIKAFLNYGKNFNIPEITIRRDIKELEKLNYIYIEMGLIKLINGKEYETTREEKILKNKDEKLIVGRIANELIKNKEIFVGTGTTCESFVKSISKPINTIYTNGYEVARIAKNNQYIKNIVIIGGNLRPQSGALCGPIAINILSQLRFLQSFITFNYIDEELNFFNNHLDEAHILNKVIEVSSQTIAMIDNSKLNNFGNGKIINNIDVLDVLVLSKKPSEDKLEKLLKKVDVKW